jgi:hypothetical protein
LPSNWSASLASFRCFSKRATWRSTSRRVACDRRAGVRELERLVAVREPERVLAERVLAERVVAAREPERLLAVRALERVLAVRVDGFLAAGMADSNLER